jgi:hypothetical protein
LPLLVLVVVAATVVAWLTPWKVDARPDTQGAEQLPDVDPPLGGTASDDRAPDGSAEAAAPRLVPIDPATVFGTANAAGASTMSPPLSVEDVVSRAAPAVVLIETPVSRGTGFYVTQDLLLTNAHVVGTYAFVTVRLAGGDSVPGRVERTSADVDLAVVRAQTRPDRNQILQLGPARAPRPGQEVLAIGSPLGLQNTVTRGIVSAIRLAAGVELIQTDAAINAGNSGGPLLDRDGRVIGITTMKLGRGAESLAFAVSVTHAVPLIEGRAVVTGLGTPQAPSLPIALSGSTSVVDARRRDGELRYEQAMLAAAERANQVDAQWARLTSNCPLLPVPTDAQRAWFVLRDQPASFRAPNAWCAGFAADLTQYVREFSVFMATAAEEARRAGVLPGSIRDARRRHRLEWTGWP